MGVATGAMGGGKGGRKKKMTKKICPQLSFIFVGEHPSKEMETNEREWDSCGRHRVYLVPGLPADRRAWRRWVGEVNAKDRRQRAKKAIPVIGVSSSVDLK